MAGNDSASENDKCYQISIETPAGRISFAPLKLGYFMKLAEYRGSNNRIFCCKYVYYSQTDFPKKIRLKLSNISKWSDSSIRNIVQELLKYSELCHTHAKLENITDPIEYYETTRKAITSFEFFKNVPGLYERIAGFISFIIVLSHQDFPKMLRPIDRKFMEVGWPPSMRLTLQKLIGLATGDQRTSKAQIEEYLLERFNADTFSEMLTDWAGNRVFTDRIHILTDAISAHNDGKFTLSIPVLLAQCEGIIASIAGLTGRKTHSDIVSEIEKLSKNVVLSESFINTITNSFLDQFKFGQNEFYVYGRNSILHGANLRYATRKNSLKAILLIDFLFEVANHVERESDQETRN